MKARPIGRTLVLKRGRHLGTRSASSRPDTSTSDVQALGTGSRSSQPPVRSASSRPPCPVLALAPRAAELASLAELGQQVAGEAPQPCEQERPTVRDPGARAPEPHEGLGGAPALARDLVPAAPPPPLEEVPLSSRAAASLEAKLRRLDEAFLGEPPPVRPEPAPRDDDARAVAPPSAAEVSRRRRIRGVVGVVVGLVALLAAGAVAGAALRAEEPLPSERPARPGALAAAEAERDARRVAPSAASPVVAAAAPEAEPARVPEAPAPAALPPSVRELGERTKAALIAGRLDEAVASARELVAATPDDALGYLYLGAAYQDLRRVGDALATYGDCVEHARSGPVDECLALGGRRR
ncbi:MAG: hypothetical protein IT373_20790 [Polyangiaceae bacterium]|nr:hypothetical protein [Polyangiaceae bacterium]